MSNEPAVHIRRMTLADIEAVTAIDRQSFSVPWSERTYRMELTGNPAAYLYVAESASSGEVVGYVGFWFIVDEAHVSTLAVKPGCRRQGIGRCLLENALREAARLGAELVSLEVRASNSGAITLYRRHGFKPRERRRGYYQDNGEDALYMILGDLSAWRSGGTEVEHDARRRAE